ncbi:MAG: hypothetical protein ACRDOH_08730 [Streptosporangiaceae bacterium]
MLARAGATAAVTGRDTLTVCGLAAGKIVAVLGEAAVPFSEVSEHRATLEEAYLELTKDAVEFRAILGPTIGTGVARRAPGPSRRTARTCGPGGTASASCCTPSGLSSARSGAG